MKTIFVTGAAGFIGSNFVEIALKSGHQVIAYDGLTYAGHAENFQEFLAHPKFKFVEGFIQDQALVLKTLQTENADWLVNFAAESHVDKSIAGPAPFVDTNIVGTFSLLTAAKTHFDALDAKQKSVFRYLQISTDEVYGTLGATGKFSEATAYQPNSPYSASKASGDLLARAWFHTYGLPVLITNCSNNYGPKQFPEKLIPHMVLCALAGKGLPVYGKGANIRDWIYVKDHARGILDALEKGMPGETYCFGGDSERTNLEVVQSICSILDRVHPRQDGKSFATQIEFVTDRPGHDFRYAIDDQKAQKEVGFKRSVANFEAGLAETIQWYLVNLKWCESVMKDTKIKYDWPEL